MQFSASALLFDNDGVLVDSHQAAIAAWATWASEFAPDWDWNTAENAGVRAEDMVRARVAPELFELANNRINQLEQDSADQTLALGGAFELLHSLRSGIWTVCTSANLNLGKARLEAARLPVPAELVSGNDVAQGKPFPDPYLLGAARLGFDIHDCVVFEDAVAGVQAAIEAEAGLIVGVSERALLSEADIVVRDLSGITFDGETLVIPDSNRLR